MRAAVDEKERNSLVNGLLKTANLDDEVLTTKYLQDHNIPVDYLDGDGATALCLACKDGSLKAVKVLIDTKASINALPEGRFVPLNMAGLYGHDEIVKYLIAEGADVNAEFGDNKTNIIINFCKYAPLVSTVRLLLESGADPNKKDADGSTALMTISWFNRPDEKTDLEIMKLLVEFGADVNAVDNNGNKALDLAIKKNNSRKVALLQSLS
jgi:ankyrin repeat protein